MDVRTGQLTILVRQMTALRNRESSSRVEVYSIEYSSFFNTVWLIINDITIGYAFGTFLCENDEVLARLMRVLAQDVLISWLQWALRWLDSWPAGLKLNTELSRFYSGTFVDLVDVWGSVLRHIIFPHLTTIIYTFGLISAFGALLGVHIYVCYAITRIVYAKVLWGMGSLWRLFRGKRFNVLRNRTDSWEYDNDQLLFGTILFTLLAFLFPTVLAYYALFALLRLSTILIQASLEMQLAFMNHFPLFALVLRVKDPWRLPGGIYFNFVPDRVGDGSRSANLGGMAVPGARATLDGNSNDSESKGSQHLATTLVPVLENQPVTFGRIFFQYTRLWARLASHYNPLRLLKSMLLGRFLAPIPRYEIRYDRAGIGIRSVDSQGSSS
ncbi:Gpi1-domain-containing protein [Gymnopus androsaceus JB14]|uniref:Gpi1-domain-containing protein n=1 Tax=Gymnopus androsaceus JB14 TaxID=1447944 RepID=A0A6A4I866_9AGAR|nr:Gpi1-domain-containing protein [Gymnopus androsaceus JB14]